MRYIQKKKATRRNKRQKRMISEVEVLLLHCSLTKMDTVVWTRLVSSIYMCIRYVEIHICVQN